MKIPGPVLFVIGGVIGVLVVRTCFLNAFEILGWQIFWDALANGKLAFSEETIANSSTFGKCVAGFFASGIALTFLAALGGAKTD